MIILGLNSAYHETSAALLVGDRLVAAAEEERFNRRKHGKAATIFNPDELPAQSIAFCLRQAGISPSQIDRVAFSFELERRRSAFRSDPTATPGSWGTPDGERIFQDRLARVPEAVSEILGFDVVDRFIWVPHHLAHAASSFYCSGETSAAILVVDGIAESASTLLGRGDAAGIAVLDELHYPHSLGFLWEKVSAYLGFSEYDACKVMGMAAYGDPAVFGPALASVVSVRDDGFEVDPDVALFRRSDFRPIEGLLGPARAQGAELTRRHHDIAAALQDVTERIMSALLRRLHALVPTPAVCLAGGVALNCASNGRLAQTSPFRRLYIPTAPHDSGTAVGAAFFEAARHRPLRFVRENQSAYLGPEFSNEAIAQALARSGHRAVRVREKEKLGAAWLADGRIVAWFQGRMEFGPRALGNRSLLADPRDRNMREVMNRKVKHRELFRPFGPSVLAEHAADWFHLAAESESYGYMLFACPTRDDRVARIPAVVHADDTARIQVVRRDVNPTFHRLLGEFHALTGVPLLLNTSFNDSEPIVCTPDDAIATFGQTNIDAMIIGDFAITRGVTIPQSHLADEDARD
jgi:carbamoyltransferase